jgi:hypothetical protein
MGLERLGTKFDCMSPDSLKFLIAARVGKLPSFTNACVLSSTRGGSRDHYQDNHERTYRKADRGYANTSLND